MGSIIEIVLEYKIYSGTKNKHSQNNSTLYERPVFLAVTGLFLWLRNVSEAEDGLKLWTKYRIALGDYFLCYDIFWWESAGDTCWAIYGKRQDEWRLVGGSLRAVVRDNEWQFGGCERRCLSGRDFWNMSSGFALLGLSCEVWVCGPRAGG